MSPSTAPSRRRRAPRPREGWRHRLTRFLHRWHARRAARAPAATGFVSSPEPRAVGRMATGRQLVAGNLMFAGHLVEAPGWMLWDIDPPDAAFAEEVQGFGWLDDLAALGDAEARALAQAWLWEWIGRSARGRGAGWEPDIAGRRVIRWIQHAVFLLAGQDRRAADAFVASLSQQAGFLERRAHTALPGLPRFEALSGLLCAGLALQGREALLAPALAALDAECRAEIDADGGISTRNPEELLTIFTLLTWVRLALRERDRDVPAGVAEAIGRMAVTLRALRHANGDLARFHGGGRGGEGLLDLALAEAGPRPRPIPSGAPGAPGAPGGGGGAMGFVRLSAGRSTLIMDAAPPPGGASSYNAHASTLAFELTSGRRPLIVNCGSGRPFGEEWRRAGRATPSHATLALEGYSSARLGPEDVLRGQRRQRLVDAPREVPVKVSRGAGAHRLEAAHDGYVASHGLTHARILELGRDGRSLSGEDLLIALDAAGKARFDARMDAATLQGLPFQLRFHLHPDVDAALDLGGTAVSMHLRSGEVWVFRHDGTGTLSLEPSVYLEAGRLRPRATKQVVFTHRAIGYATRLKWSLAKAQETATAVRDLARDETEFDLPEDLILHE